MVISSFIIEANQADIPSLEKKLRKMSGVEVHRIVEKTKVIITLEKETTDESYRSGDVISKFPEVSHLCLVYTNFEDELTKLDKEMT
ncbi:chaperone NapD [Salipaludibacillus daqingensis]|uniref:chaperone NapD n=1 Tax=Salipaludibacillus daqingensis TaxID=3041001 RepID=UPI00247466B5|nr:chaperone NapD [Salipaludibacillus daqingensis]